MAEGERYYEKDSDFMFIDKEGALLQNFKETTEDLQGQFRYLCKEIDVIWDVLNKVLLTLLPVTMMCIATLIGKLLGSVFFEGFTAALALAAILVLAYLDNVSPTYVTRWVIDMFRTLLSPSSTAPHGSHVVKTSDSSSQTSMTSNTSQQTQTKETGSTDT